MRNWRTLTALLAAISLLAAACGTADGGMPQAPADLAGDNDPSDAVQGGGSDAGGLEGELTGAGATFPTPLYQDWTFEYTETVQPGVRVNYQSIGSGGGIEQFLSQTVDWGTSERYLRDDALAEAREARGCDAIQVPMVHGSVVVAFNDPHLDGLVLDAEAIAGIFQREITSFSDTRIAELNPDRDLPDIDMIPVHRSDGSGTTSVFTTYLEHTAPNWTLGSGTEVQWPAGTVGGQGNEGVTAAIVQNPGGVGYVNQAYALENDMPQAAVVNTDGNAVYPTLEATSEAVEGFDVPASFQFDILDVGGEGFPITGTVWNFYWECGYDDNTASLLRDFWTWALTDGDEFALQLGYAPLGEGIKAQVLEAIQRINVEG
jgi:phosphate transport system substrate-binding protein